MGGYDVVYPENETERLAAQSNNQYLSTNMWGRSKAPAELVRIRFLVDGQEAASAFRFPVDLGDGLPGIEMHGHRNRPIPIELSGASDMDLHNGVLLGRNNYLGFPQDVSLSNADRLQHMYMIGQTGTGKTTLMKTMILSDMASGKGLAVIDPHGDLFEELINLVPPSRKNDVVLLDPTDLEYPPGLNLLECPDSEQRHFVVREMKAIMQRLIQDEYGSAAKEWAGPVFYRHMQMNMLLAMSDPDRPGTLLEFYEIFQREEYWKRWLPLKWSDSMLERWVEYALPATDYPARRNPQDASFGEYVSSKFEDFVFDPRLRFIFGQRHSTINISRIMDEGKILLVNLAKGKLGESNARFLGMVLMAKIQASVMARSKRPPEKRQPFFLYVDEFQSLATENFTILLSEARKFGLALILANQFISQIKDERIMQSIFGNVGTLLAFRVGQADAELLEPQFFPYFNREDLANLPNWQVCIRTTIHGQAAQPFSLHTVLPKMQLQSEVGGAIRQLSQSSYGTPREMVQAEIALSLDESIKIEDEVKVKNPNIPNLADLLDQIVIDKKQKTDDQISI